jgi:menaquinol-cytochrome c reductase iron-sulfur subunit
VTDETEKAETNPRRAFMATAVSGAIGAAVGVPALAYLASPLMKDTIDAEVEESRLGPVGRFTVGKPVKVSVTANRRDAWVTTPDVTVGSVWVVRTTTEPAEFRVMSTVCPHLGCAINKSDAGFKCPCHNSRFAETGERVHDDGPSNPSPRDMDALGHEVRDGVLFCTYRRFKAGVDAQVEA